MVLSSIDVVPTIGEWAARVLLHVSGPNGFSVRASLLFLVFDGRGCHPQVETTVGGLFGDGGARSQKVGGAGGVTVLPCMVSRTLEAPII